MAFTILLINIMISIALSQYAKEFRICFQETEGSSQCQGSRFSCSGWSASSSWSPWFRDDTDGGNGGCKYQWLIEERDILPQTTDRYKYRVCFQEIEGSSQCQRFGSSCSGWNNFPSYTLPFRDDTDDRSGGCKYQWKIEQSKDLSLTSNINHCRVCFAENEGSSQCQGTRYTCSGYSNNPSWTSIFRDDTDERAGGCLYSWKLECV